MSCENSTLQMEHKSCALHYQHPAMRTSCRNHVLTNGKGPPGPFKAQIPNTRGIYTSQKKQNLQALLRHSSWKTELMPLHPSGLNLLPVAVLLPYKAHSNSHTSLLATTTEGKQPFGCSPMWELGCSDRAKSHLKPSKQSHRNAQKLETGYKIFLP